MLQKVSAIVLAAGSSRRMGQPKLLLPLPDRPMLRRSVETLIAGGVPDVIVVLAPENGLGLVLSGLPIRIVRNCDRRSDMAGSVRCGLDVVLTKDTGVLVCPADHALVLPDTVSLLLSEHAAHPDRIIIPVHRGRRGHPTLFPRSTIEEIRSQPTLRDLISLHQRHVLLLEVPDEGVILDMDLPADYERLRKRSTEGA